MTRQNLYWIAFLLLLTATVKPTCAQNEKFNKKKYIRAADEAFKNGNIFGATDFYLEVLKNDPSEKPVLYNLAQSYFIARDYESAGERFLQAYQADSSANTKALYYAALMQKMQGNYREAIPMFQRFIKVYTKEEDAPKIKKWARTEIDGCNFAIKELKPDPFVKITHPGREINSNYGDMAPALSGDTLFFASVRADSVLTIKADRSNEKSDSVLVKLYYSLTRNDQFGQAQPFTNLNQPGKQISNPAFSEDGTRFFYTLCDAGLQAPNCEIYVSVKKEGVWQAGTRLNDEINLKGFTNTQPWVGRNAQGTDVLFFVSNREGGRGGLDIWYSVANKKGEWGTPRNAGSKVNTDRDEVTPYFDSQSSTLYFSSNGWISMGGTDIFKSPADATGKFNNLPENLGAPFNSSCDDNYYRPGKNKDYGYLVSNRPGIYSVRGKTCCYDIFRYHYDRRVFVAVKGRVIDEATSQPIAGAAVNLQLRAENVTEKDVILNTDTTGMEKPYFFNLKVQKQYKISAYKEGYFTGTQTFTTEGIQKSDTLEVDVYLKKLEKDKAYRLNNIYYDFDKWDLRPESKVTLDTLYNILRENPTIIIELSSHTDTRGSDAYNLSLSQKRAESCVNYLINERGLPKERVTAKGYGETKTLDDCTKYKDCPTDQSGDCACHQLNRRTEFKITGELDGKLIYEE